MATCPNASFEHEPSDSSCESSSEDDTDSSSSSGSDTSSDDEEGECSGKRGCTVASDGTNLWPQEIKKIICIGNGKGWFVQRYKLGVAYNSPHQIHVWSITTSEDGIARHFFGIDPNDDGKYRFVKVSKGEKVTVSRHPESAPNEASLNEERAFVIRYNQHTVTSNAFALKSAKWNLYLHLPKDKTLVRTTADIGKATEWELTDDQ